MLSGRTNNHMLKLCQDYKVKVIKNLSLKILLGKISE